MGYTGDSKGFLNYIYDRYTNLQIKDITLLFEGQITHQVMKALTSLVEEQLDEVEDDRVLRRVYHVMVESLQNINRHAEAYELVKSAVDESQKTVEALEQSKYSNILNAPRLTGDLSPQVEASVRFTDVTTSAGLFIAC
jgi:hypothetical protein